MPSYRVVNEEQILACRWTLGSSGDNVRVSIFDLDDNALDVDEGIMSSVTGNLFQYLWTPTEEHTYRIDYHNLTLDTHEYEVTIVADTVVL